MSRLHSLPLMPTVLLLMLIIARPPRSTLFPYTTLFRSDVRRVPLLPHRAREPVRAGAVHGLPDRRRLRDRKSTRLNSSHRCISYAVFCTKNKRPGAHSQSDITTDAPPPLTAHGSAAKRN